MSEGLICETSAITIRDMLKEVRDNIELFPAWNRPCRIEKKGVEQC